MDEPSWQQRRNLDNLKTARLIDELDERDSRQAEWNKRWGNDDLDLDTGRPSLSWTAELGPYWVTRIAFMLIIAAIAFTVRFCAGA